MTTIDRRSFLRGGVALGVGAVAWACAKGKPTPSGSGALSVVPTGIEGLAVGDTRQAFALFSGDTPIAPSNIKVGVAPPNAQPFEVAVQRESVKKGSGGSADKSGGTEVFEIYTFRHDFDRGGVWAIDVIDGKQQAQGSFQVFEKIPSPMVGQKAIASDSPTTSDHKGVDPICTRTPPCSMHDVTIADAVAKGKPTVITFATPAFCTSRTCGPVVDIVEGVKQQYADRASFVHIEVFKNASVANKENGDSPTFHEWKLATEPFIYLVAADGTIKDRWLGAAGPDETRRAVGALVGA